MNLTHFSERFNQSAQHNELWSSTCQFDQINMIDNRRWCKLSYFRDSSETMLFVFPALKYAKGMKHTCCKLKNISCTETSVERQLLEVEKVMRLKMDEER